MAPVLLTLNTCGPPPADTLHPARRVQQYENRRWASHERQEQARVSAVTQKLPWQQDTTPAPLTGPLAMFDQADGKEAAMQRANDALTSEGQALGRLALGMTGVATAVVGAAVGQVRKAAGGPRGMARRGVGHMSWNST